MTSTTLPLSLLTPSTSSLSSIANPGTGVPTLPKGGQLNTKNFEAIRTQLDKSLTNLEMPAQVRGIEAKALAGKNLNPTELIGAQIAVHRFNLKVEVASKSVEALAGSIRRFQQQQ